MVRALCKVVYKYLNKTLYTIGGLIYIKSVGRVDTESAKTGR